MSENDDDIDNDEIDFEDEEDEVLSFVDKKLLSKDKMNFKRKLEEYLENKKLEDELYNY